MAAQVRSFHGIPVHNHAGTDGFSNGHVRTLRWQRFPSTCLEEAMDWLDDVEMLDDGVKDHPDSWGTEDLNELSDRRTK